MELPPQLTLTLKRWTVPWWQVALLDAELELELELELLLLLLLPCQTLAMPCQTLALPCQTWACPTSVQPLQKQRTKAAALVLTQVPGNCSCFDLLLPVLLLRLPAQSLLPVPGPAREAVPAVARAQQMAHSKRARA